MNRIHRAVIVAASLLVAIVTSEAVGEGVICRVCISSCSGSMYEKCDEECHFEAEAYTCGVNGECESDPQLSCWSVWVETD